MFKNRSFSGFETFEKADDTYQNMLSGKAEIEETKEKLRVKRKMVTVSLNDGHKVLLRKHDAAYQNGEMKFSSYGKKDTTIRYHVLPFFEGKPVMEITRGDIARFVHHIKSEEMSVKKDRDGNQKRLSVSMQNEVLMYFKMLFKETVKWFDIETTIDVDREVEMPKLTRSRREYSKKIGEKLSGNYDENIKIILRELSKLEYGIFHPAFGIQLLISCTGMRIDETNALKPCKFNYEKKTLLINRSITWHPDKSITKKSFSETSTKTDEERTILLPDSIARYLKGYIDRLKKLSFYSDEMYIFCRLGLARRKDMMLDPYSLKTFDNQLVKISEEFRLTGEDEKHRKDKNHLARHAFNTLLKNNHIEEYDRKLYMGHSVGTEVNTGYTHRSTEEEKRIAEVAEEYCSFLTEEIEEFRALVKR